MTKPIVWIATPMKEGPPGDSFDEAWLKTLEPNYWKPVYDLCSCGTLPWIFKSYITGRGGVCQARNYYTAAFLRSEAEYLFHFDYDLMPKPADFISIITKMQMFGIEVMGGLYTIREPNGHWVLNAADAYGADENGILRVAELGTGFKCYRRSALEKIREKNPWLEYVCDDKKQVQWGFFSMGPVRDEVQFPGVTRWLTEDYWLDWLTRDAGIPIFVDTHVQLRHNCPEKKRIFPDQFPPVPPRIPELVSLAEKARAEKACPTLESVH